MKGRLEKLRSALMLTWGELQQRLSISESMLYFIRTGARQPSPKLLRRIIELEKEAGIEADPPRRLQVREAPSEYVVSVERKPLDIVAVRKQVEQLEAQLLALKKLLEDAGR